MTDYRAPINHMQFIWDHIVQANEAVRELPRYRECGPELIAQILTEAGRSAQETAHPLNQSGDSRGCAYDAATKSVKTPSGFKAAYDLFVQGGWTGLTCKSEYGGQNLPAALGNFISEINSAANMSFAMYPGLTHGAYSAILTSGTAEQKQAYLPNLVSGKWTGTMNLTEAQCGTDLGLIRSKALPIDGKPGAFSVTGEKIFISSGEHDLTENIIHLVLAKLPDAPEGVKGISMFIVPKFLVNPDGSLGERNRAFCEKIEEKQGIHGNSTCVMRYDGAEGYLIGEAHKGLRAMFVMMNEARLMVGVQGLSQAEIALQNARAYAHDRLQGRALTGAAQPERPADPLIVHPDIQRMLNMGESFTLGARSFAAWLSAQIDIAEEHPDPAIREKAEDFVALLTPVAKAYLTDQGFFTCVNAQQIFGGHGYIREYGMEQFVRDSRIAMIYEGANGVQAIDLVGRKLPAKGGAAAQAYLKEIHKTIAELRAAKKPESAFFIEQSERMLKTVQEILMNFMKLALADKNEAGAKSYDILNLFGIVALAHAHLMSVNALIQNDTAPALSKKILNAARFHFEYTVPEIFTFAERMKFAYRHDESN